MEIVKQLKKEFQQVKSYGTPNDIFNELAPPCIEFIPMVKYKYHQGKRSNKETSRGQRRHHKISAIVQTDIDELTRSVDALFQIHNVTFAFIEFTQIL